MFIVALWIIQVFLISFLYFINHCLWILNTLACSLKPDNSHGYSSFSGESVMLYISSNIPKLKSRTNKPQEHVKETSKKKGKNRKWIWLLWRYIWWLSLHHAHLLYLVTFRIRVHSSESLVDCHQMKWSIVETKKKKKKMYYKTVLK